MPTDTTKKIPLQGRLLWVPVDKLKVNPVAQRELNEAFVDHCAQNFDLDSLGVILVNKKGESYHVVDGQHRVEILRRIGWGDQQAQCEVFQDLTDQQEAQMFRGRNRRRSVTALADYRIALTAEDPDICEIDRVVRAQGLVVTADKTPGAIGSVSTLKRVWDRSGSVTLGRSLRIIRDAYGDAGLEAPVIDGLGLLCARYNGDLDDDAAKKKLAAAHGGVNGLVNKAELLRRSTGHTRPHCVAAAAVEIINAGRGGKKLPDWWKS